MTHWGLPTFRFAPDQTMDVFLEISTQEIAHHPARRGDRSLSLMHGALTPVATLMKAVSDSLGRSINASNQLEVNPKGLFLFLRTRCSRERFCSCVFALSRFPPPLLMYWPVSLCLLHALNAVLWTQQTSWPQHVCTHHPGGAALPEQLLPNADTASCCHQRLRRKDKEMVCSHHLQNHS